VSAETQNDLVHVVVHSTAPLQYTAFTLQEPPRLVVDIPGAKLGEIKQPIPAQGDVVRDVELQVFPDEQIVRIVLYLVRPVTHTVEVQGQQLHVTLQATASPVAPVAEREVRPPPGSAPAPASRATAPGREPSSATATVVTGVTFASFAEESVVVVQTTGEPPTVRVNQRKDPSRLTLDVERARLRPDQEKTVPVTDPAGVVTQLLAFQVVDADASVVKIVAHVREFTAFEVRQTDNVIQLVIAKPSTSAAAPKPLTLGKAEPPPAVATTPPAVSAPASITSTPATSRSPLAAPSGGQIAPEVKLQITPAPSPATPPAPPGAGPGAPVTVSEGQAPRYTGEKISLDFQNADINDILRLIAEVSGLNIIAGGDVQGTVTTRMVDVPWDQALDVILKINGLAQEREGNIIRVAPIGRFINERQETLRVRQTENQAEPTVTQLVPINYADATELKGSLEKLLSARGSIFIDGRTNTMIVTDTRKNLDDVLTLVQTLDRQTPQVMIEARIVEARRDFSRELGVRFGGQYATVTDRTFPNRVAVGGTATDPNFVVDLPAAVGAGSGGAIAFALAGASSLLNVELSALENSGRGKTISNPRIATLDNTEAVIQSGVRIPFETNSAEGTKTEFIDASLILKVTPHVTPDGFISLKVSVTNNQPNQEVTSASGQPSITTREANTAMLVRDGDTVIIGGLYKRTLASRQRGVPGLSRVPILGWLFSNTLENDDNEELLIFITPRIIRQPEAPTRPRSAMTH
jgi:type IV pilus assembly protein PilQ